MNSVCGNSFNVAELTDRCLGDADFACELLDLFNNQAPKLLSHLQSAIHEARWSDAASAAHTFKGTAGNVGAIELHLTLLELELSLRQGNSHRVTAQFADVDRLTHAALDCLPSVVHGLRAKAA